MIQNLIATILLAAAVGTNNVNRANKVTIDETATTITFTADELTNNTYTEMANEINSYYQEYSETTLTYNNNEYTLEEPTEITWNLSDSNFIMFILDQGDENYGKWQLYNNDTLTTFESNLTLNNAPTALLELFEETTIGESVLTSITSGLGLITALATAFLTGFNNLIWDSTAGALTNAGVFAFVLLGVSVSFAVVKLILRILRNNTGA